jgi:hypothetical protein
MNRCTSPENRRFAFARRLLLAAGLTALSLAIFAQYAVRPFPSNTLRGILVVVAAPTITLDGKPDRLSPGARIRNAQNMLVMSNTLIGQTLVVNYTREAAGMVHEVWILTPAEAALPRKSAGQ